MDRGILYLSIGTAYSSYTAASVAALRSTGYTGPVRIVTDDPSLRGQCARPETVEQVLVPHVGTAYGSRFYKTALFQYAYDECVFLDSDTLPLSDPAELWGFLPYGDFHLTVDDTAKIEQALDQPSVRSAERELMEALGLGTRPHLNSGVLLFKRTRAVAELFALWHREWARFRHCDQLALVRAIASTQKSIQVLPADWNRSPVGFSTALDAKSAGVKVLHFFLEHRDRWAEFVGFGMAGRLELTWAIPREEAR